MKLIKKLLFHRAAFFLVAIIVQLAVLVEVVLMFNEFFVFFYGTSMFLSILVVFWILNGKSNPAYKIAWVIPILLLPIFGGLFYIFFGRNYLDNQLRRKMKVIVEKSREVLLPQEDIIEEISACNKDAANQSRYIQDHSYFPPYKNTHSEYLPTGEIKFKRLKEELKKAQKYIFLEYFIIEQGVMWDSILEILADKAKMGVDVRVIYDDVGCLITLPYRYDKKLEKMGIKCCIFNPLKPILTSKINNRDHRKIVVIDGITGFTGGINLADEYINEYQKYGHWKDTAIMLKGEAVWNLTVMFLSMWDYLVESDEDLKHFKPVTEKINIDEGEGYVQPFGDSPLDDEPVGEIVLLNLINKAKKYVYITTPYLIIDNKMTTALTSAAKAGVDVRIITPHVADKWFVHVVTRSYYKVLIESGVKIYEYTPGFIHAKTYVADDCYGIVGTMNMDYRSLFLHFECGVWMYSPKSIKDMRDDFFKTLSQCMQFTHKELDKIKWYKKIAGTILNIFSPLM